MLPIVNKGIIIGIVALLLVGLGAYFYVSKSGKTSMPKETTSSTTQQPASMFSSIKDALSKSLSLQCSFTDASGRQTKSYIKNGAVRADITASNPKQSGNIILKDKKMYFWNVQGGFIMNIPDVSVTPAPQGQSGTATANSAANFLGSLEKFKDSCKPGVVSDSLFIPPTDVKFQDMSSLMQPKVTPAGAAAMPSGVPTNYKQYMNQYPQNP